MKSKFQKILPVLLLALVVFGGVVIATPSKVRAAVPGCYNSQNAHESGNTLEQINNKIGNIDQKLLLVCGNPSNTLETRRLFLTDKLKLVQEKQKLGFPSPTGLPPPNSVTDQQITDIQNQINGTTVEQDKIKKEEEARAAAVKASKERGDCLSWGGGINTENCLKGAVSWLGTFLVFIFSKITVFANSLFNKAIDISVREFSSYADPSGPVGASWGVIRDLVNMGFIFVLLYIAISTILGVGANDWKKLVPKLIIVALLVNFSAFFTRVIIDVSNVTANQFYLAAASQPIKAGEAPDVTTALFKNMKIFSNNPSFGLGKTEGGVEQLQAAGALDWRTIVVSTFGGVAMSLVASFVLLAGAVLFIIRTLRLLFLIILSPFAFFFMILPKTESYSEKWWKALANEALFAPAFLIMIYVVTQITKAINGKDDNSVIFFMLIIGLLLGALIVAKALGATGASKIMGVGKKLGALGAGALVGGGLGFAGRHSIGRAANWYGDKLAAKGSKIGWMGRLGMRGANKISGSSFDVRASKIAKGAGLGGILGGKAQKGGYTAVQDAAGKQDKEVYDKIKSKLGQDEADKYAATIGQRMGAGQRMKTGAALGAGIGAGVVGAFTGGVGAPLGAIVGGTIGASAGAIRALIKGRHGRNARKFDKLAQEDEKNGRTDAAKAKRQQAERSRQQAERSTTVTNRETKERLGKFEEKKLSDEIKKINDEIKNLATGTVETHGDRAGKVAKLEKTLKEKKLALEILTNKKQATEARETKAAEEKKLKDAIKAGIIEDKESGGGKGGGGEKPPEKETT